MAALVAHVIKMEAGDVAESWPEAMYLPGTSTEATVLVRQASPEDTDLEVAMFARSPRPLAAQQFLNVNFKPICLSDGQTSPRPSYADVASGRSSPAIKGSSPLEGEIRMASKKQWESKEQPALGNQQDLSSTVSFIKASGCSESRSRELSPTITKLPQTSKTIPKTLSPLFSRPDQMMPTKPSAFRVVVPQVTSCIAETGSNDIDTQQSLKPTYAEVLLTSLGLPTSSPRLKRSLTPEPYSKVNKFSSIDDRRRQRSVSPAVDFQKALKREALSAYVPERPITPRPFLPKPSRVTKKKFEKKMEDTDISCNTDNIKLDAGVSHKVEAFEKTSLEQGKENKFKIDSKLTPSSLLEGQALPAITATEENVQSSVVGNQVFPLTPDDILMRHSVWLTGSDAGDAERRFHERGNTLASVNRSKEQFETDVHHLATVAHSIEQQIEVDEQTTTPDEILKALHWELQTIMDQSDRLEISGKQLQMEYPEISSDLSHLKAINSKLKELQMQLKRKQFGQQQEVQRRSIVIQELEDWLCNVRTSLSDVEHKVNCQDIQTALNERKTQLESLLRNANPPKPAEQMQLKGLAKSLTQVEQQLEDILHDLTANSDEKIPIPSNSLVATSSALQPVQIGDTLLESRPDGSSIISRQHITSTCIEGSHSTRSVTSSSVISGNLVAAADVTSMPEVARAISAERFVRESSSQPEEETIIEEIDGVRRVTVRRVHRVVRQHVVRQRVQVQRMHRRIIYVDGQEIVTDEPDSEEGVEISEMAAGDLSHLHLPHSSLQGQRSPSPMVAFPQTPTRGSPIEEKLAFCHFRQHSDSPSTTRIPPDSPKAMRTPPSSPKAAKTPPGSPKFYDKRTPQTSPIMARSARSLPKVTTTLPTSRVELEASETLLPNRGVIGHWDEQSDLRLSQERSGSESVEVELDQEKDFALQDESAEPMKSLRRKHAKKKKKPSARKVDEELTDADSVVKDIGKPPIAPDGTRPKDSGKRYKTEVGKVNVETLEEMQLPKPSGEKLKVEKIDGEGESLKGITKEKMLVESSEDKQSEEFHLPVSDVADELVKLEDVMAKEHQYVEMEESSQMKCDLDLQLNIDENHLRPDRLKPDKEQINVAMEIENVNEVKLAEPFTEIKDTREIVKQKESEEPKMAELTLGMNIGYQQAVTFDLSEPKLDQPENYKETEPDNTAGLDNNVSKIGKPRATFENPTCEIRIAESTGTDDSVEKNKDSKTQGETSTSGRKKHKKLKSPKVNEVDILTKYISDDKVPQEEIDFKPIKGDQKPRKKKTKKFPQQRSEFGHALPPVELKPSIDNIAAEIQTAVVEETTLHELQPEFCDLLSIKSSVLSCEKTAIEVLEVQGENSDSDKVRPVEAESISSGVYDRIQPFITNNQKFEIVQSPLPDDEDGGNIQRDVADLMTRKIEITDIEPNSAMVVEEQMPDNSFEIVAGNEDNAKIMTDKCDAKLVEDLVGQAQKVTTVEITKSALVEKGVEEQKLQECKPEVVEVEEKISRESNPSPHPPFHHQQNLSDLEELVDNRVQGVQFPAIIGDTISETNSPITATFGKSESECSTSDGKLFISDIQPELIEFKFQNIHPEILDISDETQFLDVTNKLHPSLEDCQGDSTIPETQEAALVKASAELIPAATRGVKIIEIAKPQPIDRSSKGEEKEKSNSTISAELVTPTSTYEVHVPQLQVTDISKEMTCKAKDGKKRVEFRDVPPIEEPESQDANLEELLTETGQCSKARRNRSRPAKVAVRKQATEISQVVINEQEPCQDKEQLQKYLPVSEKKRVRKRKKKDKKALMGDAEDDEETICLELGVGMGSEHELVYSEESNSRASDESGLKEIKDTLEEIPMTLETDVVFLPEEEASVLTENELKRWESMLQKLDHQTQLVQRGRRQSLIPLQTATILPPSTREMETRLDEVLVLLSSASRNEDVEERWFVTVEMLLQWVEAIQYYIYMLEQSVDIEWRLEQYKIVVEQVGMLARQIPVLQNDASFKRCPPPIQIFIVNALETMRQQTVSIDSEMRTNLEQVSLVQQQWRSYMEKVNLFDGAFVEARQHFKRILQNSESTNESAREFELLEQELLILNQQFAELQKTGEIILAKHPGLGINPLLSTTESSILQLHSQLRRHKEGLVQAQGLQEQYEKLLREYKQLLETAHVILGRDITASSVQHLQQTAVQHREFFAAIQQYHCLLDSLAVMTDEMTRQQCKSLHEDVREEATDVLDRGFRLGQRLDYLAVEWQNLEEKIAKAEENIASITEPEMDPPLLPQALDAQLAVCLESKFALLKVCASIAEIESSDMQLLCIIQGKTVANKMDALRSRCNTLLNALSVVHRKLRHVKDNWEICEKMKDEVECWMNNCSHDINKFKSHCEDSVAKKCHLDMEALMRFKELKHGLHRQKIILQEFTSKAEQLNMFGVLDKKYLNALKQRLENDYCQLENKIAYIDNHYVVKLCTGLKVPELKSEFIRYASAFIGNEQLEITPTCNIDQLLHKCQDILETGIEFDTIPSEIEGSDIVCDAITDNDLVEEEWQKMNSQITAQVAILQSIQSMKQTADRCFIDGEKFLITVNDKLKYLERAKELDKHSAELAVKKIQELLTETHKKRDILKQIEQVEYELSSSSSNIVTQLMNAVQEQRRLLEDRWSDTESFISTLLTLITTHIDEWNLFNQSAEAFREQLRKCEYIVHQQTLAALDMEAFSGQIDQLATEKINFEKGKFLLQNLSEASEKLGAQLMPRQAELVRAVVRELHDSWNERNRLLTERVNRMKSGLEKWMSYRDVYETLQKELELEEMQFEELLVKYTSLIYSEKDGHIATCKALRHNVETTGQKCDELQGLCRMLQSELDISPAIKLQSPGEVEYFVQKHVVLSAEIDHHCELVSGEVKEVKSFLALLSTIDTFLDKVQKTLAEGTLTAINDDTSKLEDTVTAVKNLLIEFSDLEPNMMNLRESHGRTRLDENDREQAALAIQSWMQLYMELLQRHHWLQMELVMASDREQRLAKCQFSVEETKKILVSPNAGYDDVIQQQRKVDLYQMFLENQQDMLTTQSHLLLQAIPGDQLPEATQEVERVMLDTREAIYAANVCQQNLGLHVYLWQTYKHLRDKLAQWLKVLEREKLQLRLKHTPIKKVERILERIEKLMSGMVEGESISTDLDKSCKALIEKSDGQTSASLRTEVGRLQHSLNNVNAGLATWQRFLQRVWQLWSTVESSVGDLHCELANARQLLNIKIPSRRIHLKEHRQICVTRLDEIKEMGNKLDDLRDHEQELIESISPSDMKLLHHRVYLLRQLWNGTNHEMQVRLHLIDDALLQWENFDLRVEAFEHWIVEMESRLNDRQEMFIEDLITKLETNYRVEMDEKAEDFNSIIALGENLKSAEEIGEQNKIEDRLVAFKQHWRTLIDLRTHRLNTMSDILFLLKQLEEKLALLIEWLKTVELELNTPVTFEQFSLEEVDEKLKSCQKIEIDVGQHLDDVESVLKLCKRLENDFRACTTQGNVTAVGQAAEHFRARWERVNWTINQRRQKLEVTRELWKSLLSHSSDFKKWLCVAQHSCISSVKIQDMSFEDAKSQLQKTEMQQKEVEQQTQKLSEINRQYRKLARSGQTDLNGLMLAEIKHLNISWDRIRHPISSNLVKNRQVLINYRDFISIYQETVAWLTEMNQRVSNIEHFSQISHLEKLKQIEVLRNLLTQGEHKIQQVNQCAGKISSDSAVTTIEIQMKELNTFCIDLNARFERLRKEYSIPEYTTLEERPPINTLEITGSTPPELEAGGSMDVHLQTALIETSERLSAAETSLRSPTPVIFKNEKPPEGYALHMAFCKSSIDLVQRLIDQDEGLSRLQSVPLDVQGVMERWTIIELEAMEKERRLKDAYKHWCQLMNDLMAMEMWLKKVQTHDLQMPMDSLPHLETAVQSYKEFLMDLDTHKAIILSLNVSEQQILEKEKGSPDSKLLQERIWKINKQWEDICRNAVARQSQLHTALLHCHEFEETLADLQHWLELTEGSVRQLEPIDLTEEKSTNGVKLSRFVQLREELETCKVRIAAFQHAATQLSSHSDSEQCRQTKEELNRLSARLRVILHVCNAYIDTLDRLFENKDVELSEQSVLALSKKFFEDSNPGPEPLSTDKMSSSDDSDDALARCRQFVSRVLRTALPIQALMLIVLGMASLVPVSEQDYSCSLVNNFARSFQPMLHYTDGPPPV